MYRKFLIVKQALQYYTQREGAPSEDVSTAKGLLKVIEEKLKNPRTLLQVNTKGAEAYIKECLEQYTDWVPLCDVEKIDTFDLFTKQCSFIQTYIDSKTAERIIHEVEPSNNGYDWRYTVERMNLICYLVGHGVRGEMLIDIVKNGAESDALLLIALADNGAIQTTIDEWPTAKAEKRWALQMIKEEENE